MTAGAAVEGTEGARSTGTVTTEPLRPGSIAVNVFRNRIRGVKPRLVELNGSESDHAPGPEARAMQRAQIDDLAVRVAGLPPRYREAVVLRHVQELSYAEVAETLGQPVGTVKANVHRGLKLLRGDEDDRADN